MQIQKMIGDPKEVTTRFNTDPSWFEEINEFYRCIVEDRKITNGTSEDALQTMKLVLKFIILILFGESYNIENPDFY